MTLQKKFSHFFQKNKDRVVFRWNKLIIKLRGYFIDLKCILLIPQLYRFLVSKLKLDKDILSIGIHREGGIGDRMVLGAFVTAVKRKFPSSYITVVVNNSKDPLVRHPHIDKIKLIKKLQWDKLVKYLKHRYDIFYELRWVPKVFVNVNSLDDYKNSVSKIVEKYSYEYDYPDSSVTHRTLKKNCIDLLCEYALLEGGQKDLFININESDKKLLKSLPFDGYITIKNGAFRGRKNKCWPTDNWDKLVEKIREIGPRVILLGSENDDYVDGCYDLRGKTTIYEAAAVIENSLLHIDTEGGLVYIASSVGKKAIVLFGPTYTDFFKIDGNINIRTKDDICEPCCDQDRWGSKCPIGYNSCQAMEAIYPDEVFTRVANELKK